MTFVRCALLTGAMWLGSAPAWAQGGEADSVVYALSAASRFEVKTGKAGLLGFAGHAHVVRAHGFAGRVVYFPNAPSRSRVEIVVPADSLVVLTADTAELRKVTQAMRPFFRIAACQTSRVMRYQDARSGVQLLQ